MNAQERGIFDELIASIESGAEAQEYDREVRENGLLGCGYSVSNPAPQKPITLEEIEAMRESCPPEES